MKPFIHYEKPYLTVRADTLPEAWEITILKTGRHGQRVRTEYDAKDDSLSRDVSLFMVVRNPLQEPKIHRAFPGSLESLEAYRQECLHGVHDHWVNPKEGKWSYTYHQRLFSYDVEGRKINQIQYIIDKLSEAPHSRRAQAITWKPDVDPTVDDPACLQGIWMRIVDDLLFANVHMRSNDGFRATPMNCWGLQAIQAFVAEELSKRLGKTITPGPYAHIVDSFHIYGSNLTAFEGFVHGTKSRKFEDRVWDSRDVTVQEAFDGGRISLITETSPMPLPIEHQVRIYKELPIERRKDIPEEQRKNIETRL